MILTNGDTKLGQGHENAKEFLKQNLEIAGFCIPVWLQATDFHWRLTLSNGIIPT